MPASYYAQATEVERILFARKHGLYGLPTIELVEWLIDFINGRPAIEVGAGHGGLAKALGIRATDNRMQEYPEIKAYYDLMNQPTIVYGDNVEGLAANLAVQKYKPHVVIASWVTQHYDPRYPERDAQMYGVDEDKIIDECECYVFIGNQGVHADKSIWRRRHRLIPQDWVYSRSFNGTKDFLAVFEK